MENKSNLYFNTWLFLYIVPPYSQPVRLMAKQDKLGILVD